MEPHDMKIFTQLETDRLLIRPFKETDEEAFIRFMTEPLITNNLAFDDTFKSRDGALTILNQTLESYNSDHPLFAFAITKKLDASFIGACGINFFDRDKSEVFYAFFPNYWGNGFATEVLAKMKEYLLAMHTVKEIHAFITEHNIASIKAAAKLGFRNRGLVTKEGFSDRVFDYVLLV